MNRAEFGARVRHLRNSANLTQEEFGTLIGETQTVIRNWEKGRSLPDANDMPKIVRALNLSSVSEFYGPVNGHEPDIEIAGPNGERYVIQVKAAPSQAKTESFLRCLFHDQPRRVFVTIDQGESNVQSSRIQDQMRHLLLEEVQFMSSSEKRVLLDALTGA